MRLSDFSASELSRMILARQASSVEIMQDHLDRIDAINPRVNAVISLRDRDALMNEARLADTSAPVGWLHGLPFAVKDLCATKGLRTTWGSSLFADFVPQEDDLLAARMRRAGAIFIGKTNTPEWGHGSHSFNPVHGVTRNPYDLSMSAGGSSGGAAAGLAARMLPVADGSDMMGSLRNPAAFCNVYGFRPSWGLVPSDAEGETHLSTLSTDGPMGRTIEDVANLLTVQAGLNREVPFGREGKDFAPGLGGSIKGKKIAWAGDWGGAYRMEPGILDLCERGLDVLSALGAVIEPIAPPFPAEQLWRSWTTLRAMLNAGGFKHIYDDPVRRRHLKAETIWEIEQGRALTAQQVYEASTVRSSYYAHMARLFERYEAVVLPSAQVWPFPVEWRWPQQINGHAMDTYHRWMEVVIPISLIGLPALSVPVGFGANGLPMGMQIAGAVGADSTVLTIGQAYHLATDWPSHRPPAL
ncbi:MAG: amidase [Microgenomates group bacterium]